MKFKNILISFFISLLSQIGLTPSIFAMEDKSPLDSAALTRIIKSVPSSLAGSIAERLFFGLEEKFAYALDNYLDRIAKNCRNYPQYSNWKKDDALVGVVGKFLNESNSLDQYYPQEHVTSVKIEFILKMLRFITLAEFISQSNGIISTIWGDSGDVYCSTKSYAECQYYDEKIYDVKLYKIHLMPKDDNYEKFWIRFLSDLYKNKDILSKILMVKAKASPDELCKYLGAPKIVLYIPGGKEDAQYVLEKIYELYHSEEGCGHMSAFNEKVTDFISFAQGNRDQKTKEMEEGYPEDQKHFELPELIYFKADFDGTSFGNPPKDYKLKNPARHFQHDTSGIVGTSRQHRASF